MSLNYHIFTKAVEGGGGWGVGGMGFIKEYKKLSEMDIIQSHALKIGRILNCYLQNNLTKGFFSYAVEGEGFDKKN